MPGRKIRKDPLEGADIVRSVFWRKRNPRQHDFHVSVFQAGEHLVEIVARLLHGQSAQSVVASKLDNDDCGMQAQHVRQSRHGIFCGSSAGSLVDHFVAVAGCIELLLQKRGICLIGFQAIAGGNAVAVTDDCRLFGAMQRTSAENQKQKCDRNQSANVHVISVAGSRRRILPAQPG